MRHPWAAVAGLLLVAVLVIGAWRIAYPTSEAHEAAPPAPTMAAETSPEAGATAPAAPPPPRGTPDEVTPDEEPPAGESPGTADASPTPDPVGPPTPSPGAPPADAPPLVGTVHVDDPAGDLVDSAGVPPPTPQPAADLTGVRLRGDGETLLVEFLLAGAVPAEAGSLVWSLDIWLDETLSYSVTVQQVGTRVVSGVLDWRSGEQVPPPQPPVVRGPSVSVEVPRALLADVDGPFQWQALGQADGGYEDFVPGEGSLTWFPAP